MSHDVPVLIIGASVRAAAQSAHLAGYEVVAADLFADRDVRAIATCFPVQDYPRAFESIRQRFPELPLIYTGALENHADLLDKLATIGPLYGNDGETLRSVRNPFRLAKAFAAEGIVFPQTLAALPCPTDHHDWLVKPLCSAAGRHITPWNRQTELPATGHVIQQRLKGTPCSAAFVASPREPQVRFLGATQMLIGKTPKAANDFTYCGSVSQLTPPAEIEQWTQIGQAVHNAFPLRGVFGIDAISTPNGLVPIEVNPRYTASMEVIEPSLLSSVMANHMAACQGNQLPTQLHGKYQPTAKLIIYAQVEYDVPETLPGVPPTVRIADQPHAGQTIAPGHPILTLLGESLPVLEQVAKLILPNRFVL